MPLKPPSAPALPAAPDGAGVPLPLVLVPGVCVFKLSSLPAGGAIERVVAAVAAGFGVFDVVVVVGAESVEVVVVEAGIAPVAPAPAPSVPAPAPAPRPPLRPPGGAFGLICNLGGMTDDLCSYEISIEYEINRGITDWN